MAEGKKSFLIYCDIIHSIDHLTNEEKGILFQHLLEYVNDMNPKSLGDRVLLSVWKPIQQQLKRDLEKYKEKSKTNRENALKRWQYKNATACDGIQPHAKHADNDTDSVIENEIVKESERESNSRAFDFLKNNFPQRFETEFQMRYSNQIQDKIKFVEHFNNKVDIESLEFTDKILFARLKSFADNWVENQKKSNNNSIYPSGCNIPIDPPARPKRF